MSSKRPLEREITNYFQTAPRRVYSRADIASVLKDYRQTWQVPTGVTTEEFIRFLLEKTKLHLVRLQSDNYGCVLRYTWGVMTLPRGGTGGQVM